MPILEQIPTVMKYRGWYKGQRLMETWFSRPRAVAPKYSAPVTDVITLDWVLGFERAKKVYDKLISDQIWINTPAQKQIAEMLGRQGYLPKSNKFPGTQTFGDLSRPVPDLDAEYINFRPVSEAYALDDLTAALGAFTFRVVVAGTVRPADRRKPGDGDDVGHQVTISDVGIYIRDSYDFEGDQFLGYWDTGSTYLRPWGAVDSPQAAKRMKYGKVSLSYFQGGERIENADFRKWRMQTGKGGDFLVFSNLKRFTPPGSATFNTWAHWERFH